MSKSVSHLLIPHSSVEKARSLRQDWYFVAVRSREGYDNTTGWALFESSAIETGPRFKTNIFH